MDAKEKLALQPKGSKAENWIIKKNLINMKYNN